jgi:GTP pyrophosphokinase
VQNWFTVDVELFTGWHTWQQTEPELRRLLPAATCDAVGDAVAFALRFHGGQKRPTGAPYAEHLLEALEVLVRGAGVSDPDVLCAAVLHDVAEDTPCTIGGVRAAFGDRVADIVGWVTIPDAEEGADKQAVKEAYLRRLADAPDDAVLVKLADRASNVQTLRNLRPGKQREYYTQTVTYIVPLAASRGWWALWYASWEEAHRDLA